MIEWTTLYIDDSCTCEHDHGARAIDENTTQFAAVKCPDAGCTDDCRPQLVTTQIPAGSNGPVLVRVPRSAWPKATAETTPPAPAPAAEGSNE